MMSFLNGIFGKNPAAVPEAANDGRESILDDVRERVRLDVAGGFHGRDELIQSAIDYVADELPEAEVRPLAIQYVEQALAAHAREQRSWPQTTDCDRLDAAFAALEESGIVMRQNFTCCGTCGSSEIWDEIDAVQAEGRPAYGYGFYHMQDTDSGVDGDGVYLNYGACDEGEEPALATARAIVDALERHGLKTDWDGTWGQRIGVSLEWKRRRAI
jgi:hypothetical protein